MPRNRDTGRLHAFLGRGGPEPRTLAYFALLTVLILWEFDYLPFATSSGPALFARRRSDGFAGFVLGRNDTRVLNSPRYNRGKSLHSPALGNKFAIQPKFVFPEYPLARLFCVFTFFASE
jgi:hypothetical protein